MKYKKLTIINLLIAKAGNLLSKLTNNNFTSTEILGYKLIKDLTPKYTHKINRVGIYTNLINEKVVIKKVIYKFENMDSNYLINEAFILYTLSKNNLKTNIYPNFIELNKKSNQLSLITKYFEAKNLENVKSEKLKIILPEIVEKLTNLSAEVKNKNNLNLQVRKPFAYLISFPINLVRLILKNPKNLVKSIKLGYIFYKYYLIVLFGKYSLSLVHRDLWPDNILYSTKTNEFKIIDWESAIISDSVYDLSLISAIYANKIGTNNLISILKKNLSNQNEAKRLIALSIFNSFQIMISSNPNSDIYKNFDKFLDELTNEITPKLIYKKTLFEYVYYKTLGLITLFYKIIPLSPISKNKKIVLCYHSVSNSGWRFSIRVNEFNKQINFLNKNYNFLTLHQILDTSKNGISITFDDGYSDVLENAYPILEKSRIKATMFALATENNPNRKELDNNLNILQKDQLNLLKKSGWTIGSHTNTHSNLAKLSKNELEDEIINSKLTLENNLKIPVEYFAYPKGIYSNQIIEIVKRAGYKAAFTVDGYDLNIKSNSYKYQRISLEGEVDTNLLMALMSPLGLTASHFFMSILKFKEKIINKI